MKKIYVFAVLTICTVGCKNVTDSTPTALDGSWTPVKKMIISGKDSTTLLTENASACKSKETYTYNDDAKFIFTYYSDTNGVCGMDGTETGSYTYNTNNQILTVKYSDGTATSYTVTKLTDSELQIWENNVDYDGDGYKDKQVYYYKK